MARKATAASFHFGPRVSAERFGSWLRSVREMAGMSVQQCADELGTSFQAVDRLERGRGGLPKLSTLTRYVRTLGLRLVLRLEHPEPHHASTRSR